MSEKPKASTGGNRHGKLRVIAVGSALALGVTAVASNSLGIELPGHRIGTKLENAAHKVHSSSKSNVAETGRTSTSSKSKHHTHGPSSLPDYSKYTIEAAGGSYEAGGGLAGMVADTKKGCLHSPSAYPAVLAKALGMALKQDSCSGAKSIQILEETEGKKVQKFPLLAIDKNADSEAASMNKTIFTLMVGANDGKFIEFEKDCLTVGCTATQAAAYAATLPITGQNVGNSVRNLKAAGSPLVVVTEYPALDWGDIGCLSPEAARSQTLLRNELHDLNNTIASNAQVAGAVVVAPTDFKDHGICAPDDEKWIQWKGVGGTMSLHPNIAGQQALAKENEAVVRAFLKTIETDS